ncbi:hypothetical protein [Desmospora activa]|uniref:Uncharacterized protein n=1 Tax=Desmospora activa DSM 45169 TaxID=1121389 RepID=A0A2T4Z7P8_9BACL|nr:hypothetical protein [Desmospora activa]PTM57899.1 hypothetical protein C8J48_0464 [Desmospora activa DSM 45169]
MDSALKVKGENDSFLYWLHEWDEFHIDKKYLNSLIIIINQSAGKPFTYEQLMNHIDNLQYVVHQYLDGMSRTETLKLLTTLAI